MANVKMTNRQFLTAVISAGISPEITEFATASLAKIDEKNDKRKANGSKTAQANVAIKSAIVSAMENGVTYTAAEIVALGVEGVGSTQKASALMRQIVDAGQATVSEIKIKGKGKVKGYTLAESAESEDTED